MPMYPWHGSTTNADASSGPRIDSPSSTTQSSLQVPGLRWLPSMISRATPLPTLSSSNLRIAQQQQHQQHQQQHPSPQSSQTPPQPQPQPQTPLSHPHPHSHQHNHQPARPQTRQRGPAVIDSRSQQPLAEALESEASDHTDPSARDPTHADALADPDYSTSPDNIPQGANLSRQSGHRPTTTAGIMPNGTAANRAALHAAAASVVRPYPTEDHDEDPDGAPNSDRSRKHGKRLTTLEEVSLFNICNRHASEFGQRSNLCKWWMTVTEEFTQDQGHPYSWHSVRRKVELVTKQRMKFLDEQRDKGADASEDLSNPRWRAAVDAWIPTWRRWEDAEARRIEKRDSRKPRKRKDRPWDTWTMSPSDEWKGTTSPLPTVNQHHPGPVTPVSQSTVRLPPGFDNMFSNQGLQTPSPAISVPPSTTAAAASNPPPGTDNSMMSAMLETLGKLNRHLDSVHTKPTSSAPEKPTSPSRSRARKQSRDAQPVELDTTSNSPPPPASVAQTGLTNLSSDFINKLKDELRQEMRAEVRAELEKDRATLEEKLDSVQRTQEMILEMLRQEPA
ncbi:hypothetical protein ASPBRDRAFT_42752 [Aspergillus brasiliensis CBS 101740]|uniref:Sex determining protein n=1 Tax=Aspergillus brasiliensis (strain CBS 101740 / IMI 381727 / IBT 21946) TaxID=767769 RepID=A0A1L9UMT1_ASPBC|nr:hypothetical protein ASPBRDRAFT_42752 [Aspergillus brasiliensis CBS 101740]